MDNHYRNYESPIVCVAGGTISSGNLVYESGALVYAQRDNEQVGIKGVAMNDAATNGQVSIARTGVYRFTAGAGVNFAIGDPVFCTGTAKTVDAGTALDVAAGRVVEIDPATASTDVLVEILPYDLASPPTHA